MKKYVLLIAVGALLVNLVVQKYHTVVSKTELSSEDLAWCEKIYHRNVSCPEYGNVQVPPAVLAKEEADSQKWCDDIYHQNIICPLYGLVEVPATVLREQELEHLAWCERIGYMNSGC